MCFKAYNAKDINFTPLCKTEYMEESLYEAGQEVSPSPFIEQEV
jgi:hypothetical protein